MTSKFCQRSLIHRLGFLLGLALVPWTGSGCQCCAFTEPYQDLVDIASDYEGRAEVLYHPGYDLTRIGRPDGCRCWPWRYFCRCRRSLPVVIYDTPVTNQILARQYAADQEPRSPAIPAPAPTPIQNVAPWDWSAAEEAPLDVPSIRIGPQLEFPPTPSQPPVDSTPELIPPAPEATQGALPPRSGQQRYPSDQISTAGSPHSRSGMAGLSRSHTERPGTPLTGSVQSMQPAATRPRAWTSTGVVHLFDREAPADFPTSTQHSEATGSHLGGLRMHQVDRFPMTEFPLVGESLLSDGLTSGETIALPTPAERRSVDSAQTASVRVDEETMPPHRSTPRGNPQQVGRDMDVTTEFEQSRPLPWWESIPTARESTPDIFEGIPASGWRPASN